jgi:hypothetical protein
MPRREESQYTSCGLWAGAVDTGRREPSVQPATVGPEGPAVSGTRGLRFGGVRDYLEMGYWRFSYWFGLSHCGFLSE